LVLLGDLRTRNRGVKKTRRASKTPEKTASPVSKKGPNSSSVDDKERANLRKQAVDWLRADLIAISKLLDDVGPQPRQALAQALQHWQHDPGLASVRNKEELAKLPAMERESWAKLWADVEALRKRASEK
jgi:hypothetical protein